MREERGPVAGGECYREKEARKMKNYERSMRNGKRKEVGLG